MGGNAKAEDIRVRLHRLVYPLHSKITAILSDKTLPAIGKKREIIKTIESIPKEYQVSEAYEMLLFVLQSTFLPPSELSQILARDEKDEIVATIVAKHLIFLSLERKNNEYRYNLMDYAQGKNPLVTASTFQILSQVVLPKIETELSRGTSNPAAINRGLTYVARVGEYPQAVGTPSQKVYTTAELAQVTGTLKQHVQSQNQTFTDRASAARSNEFIDAGVESVLSAISRWESGIISARFHNGEFIFNYCLIQASPEQNKLIDLQKRELKDILNRVIALKGQTIGIFLFESVLGTELPDDEKNNASDIILLPEPEGDCWKLLDQGEEERFIDCIMNERVAYANTLLEKAQEAGAELKMIAEIIDPASAEGLLSMGILSNASMKILSEGLKEGVKVAAKIGGRTVARARKYRRDKLLRTALRAKWGKSDGEKIFQACKQRQRAKIKNLNGRLGNSRLEQAVSRKFTTFEVHHVIPIEALKESTAVQAAFLHGFAINNGGINGIPIPRKMHHLLHIDKYNEKVIQRIAEWERINNPIHNLAEYKVAAHYFIEVELIAEGKKYLNSRLETLLNQLDSVPLRF